MTSVDDTTRYWGAEPRLTALPTFAGGLVNSDLPLVPQQSPGRGSIEFDFEGVEVGTAEYAEGPTGATVISVPKGARTYVDARGGAIGQSGSYDFNHAICLAGGSVYGLAAATGVSDELLKRRGNRTGFAELALVSSAIIYDFSARETAIYPDAELGRAALRNAKPGLFPVGRAGAGRSASAGKMEWSRTEFTGQGAAFREVGGIKILAATVTNPVGVIVDRDGRIVRGNYDQATGERRHPVEDNLLAFESGVPASIQRGNTTVTVVVTNVRLADAELAQFAKQAHSSMHRGIQPFHTALDGDTLFALTTDEVDLPTAGSSPTGGLAVNATAVGTIASEVLWDAILESAH